MGGGNYERGMGVRLENNPFNRKFLLFGGEQALDPYQDTNDYNGGGSNGSYASNANASLNYGELNKISYEFASRFAGQPNFGGASAY